MQDVNNDMDDLFRNAAEKYPLKTEIKDWDKVLAGLRDTNELTPATNNAEKRKRRALWLLLLLPLAFLYTTYHCFEKSNKQLAAGKENIQKKMPDDENRNSDNAQEKKPSKTTGQTVNTAPKTRGQNANNTFINKADNDAKTTDNNTSYSADTRSKKIIKKDKANLYINNNKKISENKDKSIIKLLSAAGEATTNVPFNQTIDKNKMAANSNKNNVVEKQPSESADRIQNIVTEDAKTESTKNIVAKQNEKDSNNLQVNKEDSTTAKTVTDNSKKAAKIKVQMHTQKGFYAGMLGSFDISTIKLQRVNKAGYSLNVLAGYRFTKRLSAETGISLSKKNYYSDGKYFDKGKTGIPDRVKIYFTNGGCNMFEIPVNMKYDFALHKKSNLFFTGGLSSYIMKKESYWYHADYNMMRVYDTTKSYRNSGSNLFSVVNFSIGYQLNLNKNSALRIEPYLRVPLRGIGIANMPITSTGISIGFTQKF